MNDIAVFTTWDEPMADMAVDLLKGQNIPAHKSGAALRSSLVITVDGLGEIDVLVPEEHAAAAKEILVARFSEYDPGMYGAVDGEDEEAGDDDAGDTDGGDDV